MSLLLKTTGSVFEVDDPGGWVFKIETNFETGYGWSARAVVRTAGMKEERDAIEHLRTPLRRLLKQLDAEFGYEDAVHSPGGAR